MQYTTTKKAYYVTAAAKIPHWAGAFCLQRYRPYDSFRKIPYEIGNGLNMQDKAFNCIVK